MTAIPGFIDCHNHAPGTRLLNDVIVGNPYEVEFVTIDGLIDKLKARANTTPPGAWVEGQFFDDTKVKDGRELNVHDLDKVSLDHPVVVNHCGGHTSFYNGAHCSFEEQLKGSITPGKLADYVMLASDPPTVDPNTIKDIKITRTVTGGRVVYEV
jgi:predicted amidohydrolase YtcJ